MNEEMWMVDLKSQGGENVGFQMWNSFGGIVKLFHLRRIVLE